jgi:hypothetical protein
VDETSHVGDEKRRVSLSPETMNTKEVMRPEPDAPQNIYLDNLPRLGILRRSVPHGVAAGRPFPNVWQLSHKT